MSQSGDPSSSIFPRFEPVILEEMENLYDDSDVRCFNPALLESTEQNSSRELDNMFFQTSSATNISRSASYISPSKLTSNGATSNPNADFAESHSSPSDTRSDSPGDSSSSSSADSPPGHARTESLNSLHDAAFSPSTSEQFPDGWPNSDDFPGENTFFGQVNRTPSLQDDFLMDTDIEISNKAMDSAFDFESAASSPSPLKLEPAAEPKAKPQPSRSIMQGPSSNIDQVMQSNSPSSSFPRQTPPFYFKGSSKSPTPTGFSTKTRSNPKQWDRGSPSSELEKPFGGISMNSDSPINATLSPSLNFGIHGFNVENMKNGALPPYHVNGAAMAAGQANPNNPPFLFVHPTSLKSRVETQIPIKLTLHPLLPGVKKLRLPRHAISKPKFFAKPDTERSPEILELLTSVVCTSAMQDKAKLDRAFARARGEIVSSQRATESETSRDNGSQEETPLEGAEVKICSGCIQRERKRASRKKLRKPEEDELFQKDEDKRIVVFNTTELRDWVESPTSPVDENSGPTTPIIPRGSVQVELPMRIACYCRHQSEKLGFRVIFTIRDYIGNVIAQTITNSIMITDDHKTHIPVSAAQPNATLPDRARVPGAGVFPAASTANKPASLASASSFRLSHSATDLQALRNHPHPLTPGPGPLSQNQSVSPAMSSTTPRNLSRQASPTDFPGPSSKRRKQSGSGKVPATLTMTKMDAPRAPAGQPTGPPTVGAQFPPNFGPFASQAERPFVTPASTTPHFTNGPPTPNANDSVFFNPVERSQAPEDIVNQLVSAPSSAHTSRPGSPGPSTRNVTAASAPALQTPMWSIPPPNPPTRLPTMIHKLVPAEGSVSGGSEVTLLGSGFYPGMEVVFGDTLATTTTFWGDKCLNCLTPPALHPGSVPVTFKHEHPKFGQVQQHSQPMMPKQQIFFRYVDDRELQMYRVALAILGQKLRNPADAFTTAQQIMGADTNSLWGMQNNYQNGGGQQRHAGNSASQGNDMSDLDARMVVFLDFMSLDDSSHSTRFDNESSSGQTLLHYASSLNLTRFVSRLLDSGADPNAQDNNGNTPLHLAALAGQAHIIHRLRFSGANVAARNIRGYTPADLASTLDAHQAAFGPERHYRSRSVGSTPSPRRRLSSASLDMSWGTSSSGEEVDASSSSPEDSDDESVQSDVVRDTSDEPLYYPPSRRASTAHETNAAFFYGHSQEGNVQASNTLASNEAEPDTAIGKMFSPPVALVAWRDQLAGQIHQFQQSVNRAFPNLPALPPIPALPDYQTHPMMRRISSLVPNRPTAPWPTTIVRDGWDRLTGTLAPPAYDELYPVKEEDEAFNVKKASVVRAAADATADQHFESIAEASSSSSLTPKEIGDVRIGRDNISPEEQEKLRQAHAQKMKRIRSDRNLFFIWIPLLVIIVVAMMRNLIPNIGHGISQGYEFIKSRYRSQPVEELVGT
ncbi:hypothetical protein AJ80_08445 [Polytolypa hystricis UAMH7299]|uniref:Uncharacterized protein n=1 Tax=Polytolypa hystricis (strain UAMH7299) TaxID=1447883 RepID=A0A2B7X751_POLH7|nr:hypothetical protein AJ80_08445 [Polytolypa hystricis UAMH7299]